METTWGNKIKVRTRLSPRTDLGNRTLPLCEYHENRFAMLIPGWREFKLVEDWHDGECVFSKYCLNAGDKVTYEEKPGEIFTIEKNYGDNVFLIGNENSFCDMVPDHLLQKVENDSKTTS